MPRVKVLIIEDDRPIAEVLTYNLKNAGYEVFVATDGQDGLNQAQLKSPDVVVLDLMLPVIDGQEVCKRLRADPATRDTLIMMLTAKAEETDQLIGFSLGADDYVTKPFSVKVVMERIKALRRRRAFDPQAEDTVACHGVIVEGARPKANTLSTGSESGPLELPKRLAQMRKSGPPEPPFARLRQLLAQTCTYQLVAR